MKVIRFLFAFVLTSVFFYFLNTKQGNIPPIGNFINPFMGFWQNGEKSDLDLPDIATSDQLNAPVVIRWDDLLIPHIFAQNDYDLYFAQGYVHAFHRLWQMEFQIYATEGRLSEIIGERTIKFDRSQRRKGLKYAALRSYNLIRKDPKLLNELQAYTDGVNYWIDQLSFKDYPIEYKMMDYKPEAWTNLKSVLLLKYMGDMLSSQERDLENTNALQIFGEGDFNLLFPETFPEIDPVIPISKIWDFEVPEVEKPNVQFPNIMIEQTIDKPDPRNGSNNFAVSGSKTANGKVIFTNEMDLGLNLPSLWYAIQLNAPGINTLGCSLPGSPGVIAGYNDSIAWGSTNAKQDVVDWYKIDFRNEKRKEYRYDDKWLKTEKIVEKIKVKGGSTVYDTIVYTHYGPIVYDRNFMGKGEKINFAMKWTVHEESKELNTFYLFNRAKGYEDYVEALRYFDAPAQNWAMGAGNGDIAIWVAGKFPIKWEGQGKFLMDGSDSRQEWQGYIPHEHKASIKNPESGFISSANQHPVDSTYPYYIYDHHFEHYRNRRINDRLRLLQNIQVEDMMKLQNDNFNYQASESLPMMLDSLDTAGFDQRALEAYRLLRKWDYFNEPDRLAPSVYQQWVRLIFPMIWDEIDSQEVAMGQPSTYNTIRIMNRDPQNKFFDILETEQIETAIDLINMTFIPTLDSLDQWKKRNNGSDYKWYLFKNTRVNHLIPGMEVFSVDHIKIGGYSGIVNAASGRHGPSWRMVVELGNGQVTGWGVYPGSQTGNPGNPKYAHMIEDWASGNYYKMNFLQSVDEENENIIFTQTLEPNTP